MYMYVHLCTINVYVTVHSYTNLRYMKFLAEGSCFVLRRQSDNNKKTTKYSQSLT